MTCEHCSDSDRGTGRTTRQLKSLKLNGVFIWCNDHLAYPIKLAKDWGRPDIKILGRSALSRADRYRGQRWSAIVVDHALEDSTYQERQGFEILKGLVR